MTYSTTLNDALQYSTSTDKCLDLFSKIGNMRWAGRNIILKEFEKAYKQNSKLATRVLFWARAARIGAGERKTFHTILSEIGKTSPEFIVDNAKALSELGYWKDLIPYLYLDGVVSVFAQAIKDGDRLACKWAPRKCPLLKDKLGFTNKEYRKWLKKHSDTTEQQMTNQLWSDINYSSVPGAALRRYSSAFNKNDNQRYNDWKSDKTKTASVSATYPHEVMKCDDEILMDKLWNSLPDHIKPGERILPMIDVSGSMMGIALDVAISLGMYLAERNKSEFKDVFLTFSENPQLVRLQGNTIAERLRNIERADWDMNTDFEKAYRHILNVAIKHNVNSNSMPTMLLVLSDMQFDRASRNKTHLDIIKSEYEQSGYEFPKLVFWNLDMHDGIPAQATSDDVALVSGFSPAIMKAILNCEDFNPINVMMEALELIKLDYTNLSTKLDIDYQSESF
jgi:hypothetical protein